MPKINLKNHSALKYCFQKYNIFTKSFNNKIGILLLFFQQRSLPFTDFWQQSKAVSRLSYLYNIYNNISFLSTTSIIFIETKL